MAAMRSLLFILTILCSWTYIATGDPVPIGAAAVCLAFYMALIVAADRDYAAEQAKCPPKLISSKLFIEQQRSLELERQTGLVFNEAGWMWPGYWRNIKESELSGGVVNLANNRLLCPEDSKGRPARARPGDAESIEYGWRPLSDEEIIRGREDPSIVLAPGSTPSLSSPLTQATIDSIIAYEDVAYGYGNPPVDEMTVDEMTKRQDEMARRLSPNDF